MSDECKDFISKLLEKKPENRLGTQGGLDEVLAHPWFAEIDPKTILSKEYPSPMKPILSENQFDT